MMDTRSIDELARRLTANLPPGVREFQEEVEKNVKASLQSGFSRLDLVTREEFDAQAKVLARTRQRLEELERRVARLEGTDPDASAATDGAGESGPA